VNYTIFEFNYTAFKVCTIFELFFESNYTDFRSIALFLN